MYQGKVDLHLHLDGSMSIPFAVKYLKKYGLPVPEDLAGEMSAPEFCENLEDYLRRFDLPDRVLQYEETLEECAFDLTRRLAEQGLLYAEIRFAPARHYACGLTADEVVDSVIRGLRRGEAAYPSIRTGLLLCCLVAEDRTNFQTLEAARRRFGNGVSGLDLAGPEGRQPLSSYASLFAQAREAGIPFTIHAGECGSAENIRTAISFGARRIGHGVAAIQSQADMALLRERETVIECCFTSNLQTRAVAAPENHPIRAFYDNGLRVTVNTDNMTVSGVTLSQEQDKLRNWFHFTDTDFRRMDEYAISGAFLPEAEKTVLLQQLTGEVSI